MNVEERIKEEKIRLAALLLDMPREGFYCILGLVEQAAFLKVTLDDLQESIVRSGATDDYKNGKDQYGKKISAELSAYNKTLKLYQKVTSDLMGYVPRVSSFRPVGVDETEYQALKRFRDNEKYDYYLSDDFKRSVEEKRQEVIDNVLEGQ